MTLLGSFSVNFRGKQMLFHDRHQAGKLLADALPVYKNDKGALVLGLARGGVSVAYEVARALSLPLNVIVPRKVGAPGNSELALGSIMEDGEGVFNTSIIHMLNVSPSYLQQEIEKEKRVAHQRLALYRQNVPLPQIAGKTVILVDDGIATGSTILASIKLMRKEGARKVVVAVPVSSQDALRQIEKAADEVVCLSTPFEFFAVGQFYSHFGQTDDSEVIKLLDEANQ